jgi:predicted GNAT superfamily acetyltransferase
MTPDNLIIRPAASAADYQALQMAQRRAWGITGDGYVVPVATMVGAQLHGGLVLGAFAPDGNAAGLSFAFLGRSDGRLCLYSQLTGVVPDYQGLGLGLRLKQAQLAFARAQGLELVAWAFDPLQAGNGHFNLARLGATSRRYIEDMYGVRTDALNQGAATDRLIVEWSTTPRQPTLLTTDAAGAAPRLIDVQDGVPRLNLSSLADDRHTCWLIEVPEGMAELRTTNAARAAQWQQAVRVAFQTAFAQGLVATGFCREATGGDVTAAGRHCFYVLTRPRPTHA